MGVTFPDENNILKLSYFKIIYVITMAGSTEEGPWKVHSLKEEKVDLFCE